MAATGPAKLITQAEVATFSPYVGLALQVAAKNQGNIQAGFAIAVAKLKKDGKSAEDLGRFKEVFKPIAQMMEIQTQENAIKSERQALITTMADLQAQRDSLGARLQSVEADTNHSAAATANAVRAALS